MADASVPPEGQARVRPFDPLVLDKTIIALPLLELMQEDFARINAILKDHPEAGTFNTAIQYNGRLRRPGGRMARGPADRRRRGETDGHRRAGANGAGAV